MLNMDKSANIYTLVLEIVNKSFSDDKLIISIGQLAATSGDEVYSSVLRVFASVDLDAKISKAIWERAIEHAKHLSGALNRPVGVVIAVHDLLANFEQRLTRPKIIELDAFEKIEKSSVTDKLTGLYNFAFFREQLGREVAKCIRYGSILSLVMFDLDNFKSFNDKYGHNGGNQALKEFASVMKEKLRTVDIIARFGGEEFAYILPMTGTEGAIVVAERIRKTIELREIPLISGSTQYVHITCSGGIATFEDGRVNSAEQIIEKADQALYRAKAEGKNRIIVYTP